MICSKCNNEIPNGAKFCTVCGTPVAAEPAKILCAKCGLELAAGAKFCTSCGTPVAAAAVSLNKEPNADDLVAAMNTAAPAAAAVPTPVPAPVPTPAATAVPTPVPTPAATAASVVPQPTYNNGFAPTGAPNSPSVPAYAPTSGQMPAASDPAAFNGAAVAAVAAPAKAKKSPVKGIVITLVCVVVALVGAAAGWFFSNRASFLSTFMGKPKYAAMVEKETFKEISKELDTAALSNQIKTVSSVMGAVANNASTLNPYDGLYGLMADKSASADYAQMRMSSSSNNPFDGMDISGMITSYHEFMQSTYGADAISGKISLKIDNLGAFDAEDVDPKVLDLINNSTINYNYAASENALGTIIGADLDGTVLDIQAVMQDDGSIYFSMPFASKTGFLIKTNASGGSSAATKSASLDLDPEEIDRLIEELAGIYTKHVESSSVTMDKGSLYVAGKEISGKLIIADINGNNFENMMKEMFEHIANDEYFSKQIVDYINNFDEGYTVADFKNDISDMVIDMDVEDSDKLIIRTVVNNSGKTLAKSFALCVDGTEEMNFAFADNDSMTVFEILVEGDTLLNMVNEKTDDKNGKITIKVSNMDEYDPEEISVIVDYKGVEKVTYGKTEVEVGTYTISMTLPTDSYSFDDEEVDMINNSSFTVGTTVNGATINYNIGATISGAAKIELNMDLTFNDDTSALTPPSDVIDLTDVANGGEPDQATQDKLMAWLGDLQTAIENSGLADTFGGIGGGSMGPTLPTNPTNPTNPSTPSNDDWELRDKYWDLEEEVWDAYFDVDTWIGSYDIKFGTKAYDVADSFQDELYDLIERISDKAFDYDAKLSESELNDFKKEFEDIYKDAENVLQVLYNESTVKDKPAPTLPFAGTTGSSQGGVYGPDGNLLTDER